MMVKTLKRKILTEKEHFNLLSEKDKIKFLLTKKWKMKRDKPLTLVDEEDFESLLTWRILILGEHCFDLYYGRDKVYPLSKSLSFDIFRRANLNRPKEEERINIIKY